MWLSFTIWLAARLKCWKPFWCAWGDVKIINWIICDIKLCQDCKKIKGYHGYIFLKFDISWHRKTPSSGGAKKAVAGGGSGAGMWRFYTEDSPGIKV